MASAPNLSRTVSELTESGRSRLVVDLSGTDFMDSSGLGALVASLKRARQAGGDLRLCCAGEQVQMVLQLTNLNRVLRVFDSVEDAADGFR
jgi:anti-anti-sigma factor